LDGLDLGIFRIVGADLKALTFAPIGKNNGLGVNSREETEKTPAP
jgi:hypothetical protein